MRRKFGLGKTWTVALVVVLAAGLAVTLSACGSSNKSSTTAATARRRRRATGASTTAAPAAGDVTKCGTKPGVKATGTPIKLGAIVDQAARHRLHRHRRTWRRRTSTASTTTAASTVTRSSYTSQTEQTDPAQVAALAKKLIETDKVVGIVGQLGIIECAVNHKLLRVERHLRDRRRHRRPSAIGTPNSAPRQHGSALQLGRRRADRDPRGREEDRVRPVQRPGHRVHRGGPTAVAKQPQHPDQQFLNENVPIQDANAIAAQARAGGRRRRRRGPELHAARGAEDPPGRPAAGPPGQGQAGPARRRATRTSVAKALGSQWNDKLLVNAELNLTDATGPDSTLYRAVLEQVRLERRRRLGSFSQMGFCIGQLAVQALLNDQGRRVHRSRPSTRRSTNLKGLQDGHPVQAVVLRRGRCTSRTTRTARSTPKNGKMVIEPKSGCLPTDPVDPEVATIRSDREGATSVYGATEHRNTDVIATRRSGVPMPSWSRISAVHRHRPGPGRGVSPCPGSGWWCSTGQPACSTWPSAPSARWAP